MADAVPSAELDRVHAALTQMSRQKTPITYRTVAQRAKVSRTFLYENPNARTLMSEALTWATDSHKRAQAAYDDQQEASWRQRALNAEDALKSALGEIQAQRDRIAVLMGTIRDLEQDWSHDAAQRIAADNTKLKQRVRQLTQDKRTLEERLQAARSNARFADRRIAQLEAQLLDSSITARDT
jgi:hypothetical protein